MNKKQECETIQAKQTKFTQDKSISNVKVLAIYSKAYLFISPFNSTFQAASIIKRNSQKEHVFRSRAFEEQRCYKYMSQETLNGTTFEEQDPK